MGHDEPVPIENAPVAIVEQKSALRRSIRTARAQRTPEERVEVARGIATRALELVRADTTVAFYLSFGAEPGTFPALAACVQRGARVLLPRIVGDGLEWVRFDGAQSLARGPLGIREPVGRAVDLSTAGLDLLLLPALAGDPAGHRLGQGGGYYDRALAALPSHASGGPLRVVVLHDDELRDDVPSEAHDLPVDAALTPSSIHWFTENRW
jgi:5-formyltetrahydrofolate cyclo-ligase